MDTLVNPPNPWRTASSFLMHCKALISPYRLLCSTFCETETVPRTDTTCGCNSERIFSARENKGVRPHKLDPHKFIINIHLCEEILVVRIIGKS